MPEYPPYGTDQSGSGIQGQISYSLGGTAHLVSFPFIDKNYTPETLNEALGGSIGGSPPSSSVLGSIIGLGESTTFVNGTFVGPLTDISPFKAYWIKPASGSTTFSITASISGELINVNRPYLHGPGPHMVAYPFDENREFSRAVKTGSDNAPFGSTLVTNAINNNGYHRIVGEGTVMQYNFDTNLVDGDDSEWVGNITTFTTGSGYFFIKTHPQDIPPGQPYNGLSIPLFADVEPPVPSAPTIAEPPFEWRHCLDVGYDGNVTSGQDDGTYGRGCTWNGPYYDTNDGNVDRPYYSNAQAHSFGHSMTSDQTSILWSNEIGDGSGSLFDSASNDMSGSTDGTNDFIVGWFATSSADNRFPMCCGASAWHDNQFSVISLTPQRSINFAINKVTQNFPFEDFGYPLPNTPIVPRIYDPRRNMLVSGSVHEVNYDSNGKPSIGDKTILSASTSNIGYFIYMSASAQQLTDPNIFSSKVIVMDH